MANKEAESQRSDMYPAANAALSERCTKVLYQSQ